MINSDDTYTTTASVTLTLSASDANGVAEMRFSNDDITYSTWESYGTSKAWTLTDGGDGTKSVYVEYRDNAGVVSSSYSDDIILDTTAPSTTLTIGTPKSGSDPTYVSTATTFTLTPSDVTSSIGSTEYQFVEHGAGLGTWTTYSSPFIKTTPGSYDLYYRSVDNAGNLETAKMDWIIVGGTTISYGGGTSGEYSDPVTLSGTLVDKATSQPIEGKTISFSINISPVLTASGDDYTDSNGEASTTVLLMRAAGSYTVTASFAGDSTYLGCSSDPVAFTINKEKVTIYYTGHEFVWTAGPDIHTASVQLSALCIEQNDGYPGDLTKLQVSFTLDNVDAGPPHYTIVHIPVNSLGEAYATQEAADVTYSGLASIELNDYYLIDYDSISLTVTTGTEEQTVTGGGWIQDKLSVNGKDNFGFTVKYNKKGDAKGSFVYSYRTEDYIWQVKSNSWRGGGLSFTGKESNKAFFSGRCTIQQIDRETGETLDSMGNCRFLVDITDVDLVDPHGTDTIAFLFLDTDGNIWRQIGSFESQIELGGGNIIIHR